MAPPRSRPSPPVQMRESLQVSRSEGLSFDVAWEIGLKEIKWPYDTVHRRQWREALKASRDEFRASYLNKPSRTASVTNALLAALNSEGIDPNEYELIAVA